MTQSSRRRQVLTWLITVALGAILRTLLGRVADLVGISDLIDQALVWLLPNHEGPGDVQ